MDNEFDQWLIATNKLGAKTIDELFLLEKPIVFEKMQLLIDKPLDGELDYNYLKNVHYELFKDVYSFAGQDRYDLGITAQFGKGNTEFTSVDNIPKISKLLFDELRDFAYYKNFDRREFLKEAPLFFSELNRLHPFREGNGRTQRLFMNELARQAGFELDLNKALPIEMLGACAEGINGKLDKMIAVFDKYCVKAITLDITQDMTIKPKSLQISNDNDLSL